MISICKIPFIPFIPVKINLLIRVIRANPRRKFFRCSKLFASETKKAEHLNAFCLFELNES